MVVADLDVIRVAVDEPKADTPLVVHGDRVLSLAVTLERMEPIPGGTFRSSRLVARSTYSSLRAARLATIAWEPPGCPRREQLLGALVRERLDHLSM